MPDSAHSKHTQKHIQEIAMWPRKLREEEAFIRHYWEAWRAVIHGVTKSRTRLSKWTELNWDIFEKTVNFYRELSSGEALHRRKLCCYSVTKSCLTLCSPMDCSTSGVPVFHYLPELAQTHVHWVDEWNVSLKLHFLELTTHCLSLPSKPAFMKTSPHAAHVHFLTSLQS